MEELNKQATKSTGALQKPAGRDEDTSNRKGGEPSKRSAKVVDSEASKPGVSGTSATQGKGRVDIPLAKRRYRNRRSAFRILEKWAATPEGQLTEDQKMSVAWAKSTVQGSPERGHVSKRQRSQDEVEMDSKRTKRQTAITDSTGKTADSTGKTAVPMGRTVDSTGKKADSTGKTKLFSDVVKERALMLAVIDESHEEGSISLERWRLVYNALNLVFLEVLRENPGPPPSCRDAGWHQGRVRLIACSEQRSVDLYKLAIAKVGALWPGAKLAAVSREEIPSLPRARVWLPSEPASPSEVLKIIRFSNPDLPTENWKIVKQEDMKEGRRLSIMVLNKESLVLLEKTKGVINFGFGSITLNVYKKDGAEARTGSQPGDGGNPPEEATRIGVSEADGPESSEERSSCDLGLELLHFEERKDQQEEEVVGNPDGGLGTAETMMEGIEGGETVEAGASHNPDE